MNLNRWSQVAIIFILAVIALAMIPGCVSLEAPKSFNEKLAYGYASVAASRNTAASLLERKRLTVQEAKDIQDLADQARTGLDIARGAAGKGDMSTADKQLDLALTVLTAIEGFLKEKQ